MAESIKNNQFNNSEISRKYEKMAKHIKQLNKSKIATRNDNFYAWRCLEALGIDTNDGVLRISMTHYNSLEEVNRLISVLQKIN